MYIVVVLELTFSFAFKGYFMVAELNARLVSLHKSNFETCYWSRKVKLSMFVKNILSQKI